MDVLTPGTFLASIGRLFEWYVAYAWPFVVLHGLLALWVAWFDWRTLFKEVRALESWQTGEPGLHPSTRILSEYVDAAMVYSRSGQLLPLQDYTQRLEDHIGASIGRFQTHVNLFLILGVAGTFFALFEFASQSIPIINAVGGNPGKDLSMALSRSLAHAFPVSFFGLLWTITGHLIISRLDTRLRAAVREKVGSASREIVPEKGLPDRIREALQPLEGLDTVLHTGLAPLMERLDSQLQQMTAIAANQFAPLAEAVESMRQTMVQVESSVGILQKTAEPLPEILKGVRGVQESAQSQSVSLADAVSSIAERSEAMLREIEATARKVSELPTAMLEQQQHANGELLRGAEEQWSKAGEKLSSRIDEAATHLTEASKKIGESADKLAKVPDELKPSLEASLQALTKKFEEEQSKLSEKAIEVWKENTEKFVNETGKALMAAILDQREEVARAAKAFADSAEELKRVSQNFESSVEMTLKTIIKETTNDIAEHLKHLDEALVNRYPQVLESLTQTVQAVGDTAKNASDLQTNTAKTLEAAASAQSAWEKAAKAAEDFSRALESRPMVQVAEKIDRTEGGVREVATAVRAIQSQMSKKRVRGSESYTRKIMRFISHPFERNGK